MFEVLIFFKENDVSCLKFKQVENKISKEFSKDFVFKKINTNIKKELTKKYKILNLPSLIILKDGKSIRNINGVISEENLRTLLNNLKN